MEEFGDQKEMTNSILMIESSHSPYSIYKQEEIRIKKKLVDKVNSLKSLLYCLEQDIKDHEDELDNDEIEWVMSQNTRLMAEKESMNEEISQLRCAITEARKSNADLRGNIEKFRSQFEERIKQNHILISKLAIKRGQKTDLEATNPERILLENKPTVVQQNIQLP